MSEKPEAWALERAKEIFNAADIRNDPEAVLAQWIYRTFALYIQAHEQPPEPDWEAWRPALDLIYPEDATMGRAPIDDIDKDRIRRIIAASKVMLKGDV